MDQRVRDENEKAISALLDTTVNVCVGNNDCDSSSWGGILVCLLLRRRLCWGVSSFRDGGIAVGRMSWDKASAEKSLVAPIRKLALSLVTAASRSSCSSIQNRPSCLWPGH